MYKLSIVVIRAVPVDEEQAERGRILRADTGIPRRKARAVSDRRSKSQVAAMGPDRLLLDEFAVRG